MGGGWQDYVRDYGWPDYACDGDSDCGHNHVGLVDILCAQEYHYDDYDYQFSDSDEFDFRPHSRKNRCRYCSGMFYKKCTSCPYGECRPTCAGTLVKHDCSLKFLCDVCHKRFGTKEELEAGSHGFRRNGMVVNCNEWVALDTIGGTRLYQTKADQGRMKIEVFKNLFFFIFLPKFKCPQTFLGFKMIWSSLCKKII